MHPNRYSATRRNHHTRTLSVHHFKCVTENRCAYAAFATMHAKSRVPYAARGDQFELPQGPTIYSISTQ